VFRIGEFSKMSKTTIKALRYYDETDLLKPEHIDPFTGYRFYTTRQLLELHHIQSFRQVGLSIDEIRLVLSGQHPAELLERRRTELLDELADRQDQLSRIDFILQCQEDFAMNYVATMKDLPECIVYSKRFTAPSFDSYFQLIPAIGEQLKKQYPDLKCAVPEYCYLEYLDGEYRERNIHVELCEAVTELRPDFDDIVFKKAPAITALSVMHKGPYTKLREAYAFTLKWIEDNGYQVTEPARESYIDGIWNKETDADWLTELQFPVVKK
jgi:DNA-binding transcriptional MerR regulator